MAQERFPSLTLVQETIEKQLDAQIGHIDSLDTKAGILLGFLAVTLATIVASKDFTTMVAGSSVLKVSVVATFLAFGLSLAAFGVRQYRRDPKPRELRSLYPSAPEERTRFDLADSYVVSFEENLDKIKWKVRALQAALVCASIAGLGVTVHLVGGW